jgi:signal transduction histidine kinase
MASASTRAVWIPGARLGWRTEPPPRRWRLYSAVLATASLPFFVHGFVALARSPVPAGFLAALLVALITANFCILELPPYRFLHLVMGLVTFGTFFIVGPAILALVVLAAVAAELQKRLLRRASGRDRRPLGSAPAEYSIPAAALGITLGGLDALRGPLGLSYPYQVVGASAEGYLILLQFAIYGTFILLTEVGTCLRFGWKPVFGTPHARADLLTYVLVIFPGGPILSGITRAYGPNLGDALFVFWYILVGFGTFAVAAILVRRRLEVERLAAVVGQQQRLAALGELASVIAHQTRHHLGVLGMSAYVLGETLATAPLSPAARAAVASELEAMARTREELDRLLAQELRGGGAATAFAPLELARECGANLKPLADAHGVAFSYAGEETSIQGDRLRLKQAITNVMRNAIEAAPRGSSVAIAIAVDTDDVRLSVSDRGPGLSASARSHLFEPLFTEKSDGLGMGLYVARAIVEAHGGMIMLASTAQGTAVNIRLARTALPAASEGSPR